MTCIVGLVDGKNVIIGGDSAASAGFDIDVRSDSKVFTNGKMAFGFTTSFRMGQILRYSLKIPKHPKKQDTFQYMVTKFIDSVRNCMSDSGFKKVVSEQEEGGTFLVGYRGRLFKIYSDFQVAENSFPYEACGCGEAYSKGTLNALSDIKIDSIDKVYKALSSGSKFSAGVCPPFRIIKMGRNGKVIKEVVRS